MFTVRISLGLMTEGKIGEPIFYIRHGESIGQGKPNPSVDDPLSPIGKSQAVSVRDNIFDESYILPVSDAKNYTILASPLSRALETATIIFGNLPNAKIYPTVELREFNAFQKRDQPLFVRHQGSSWEILKQKFNNVTNIEWGAANLDNNEWWEPHGDITDCHKRTSRYLQVLWDKYENRKPNEILVVVCHENFFRVFTGEIALQNCSPTSCWIEKISFTEAGFTQYYFVTQTIRNRFLELTANNQDINFICAGIFNENESDQQEIMFHNLSLIQNLNYHFFSIFTTAIKYPSIFGSLRTWCSDNNIPHSFLAERVTLDVVVPENFSLHCIARLLILKGSSPGTISANVQLSLDPSEIFESNLQKLQLGSTIKYNYLKNK